MTRSVPPLRRRPPAPMSLRAPVPARLHAFVLALAALGGCATAPSPAAPPAAAGPSRPTLLDEQRRLDALFRGTPVVFTMQSSTRLRVDVPLQFCFDAGQATVKPALAAVVDRLAQSQRDAASRFTLGAPGDRPARPAPAASAGRAAGPAPALAGRRAAALRDRFAAQGIAAERLTLADADAAGVSVVVEEPPPP